MGKKYAELAKGKKVYEVERRRVVTLRITDGTLRDFIEHLRRRGINISEFTRLVWKDTPDYAEYLAGLNNAEKNNSG